MGKAHGSRANMGFAHEHSPSQESGGCKGGRSPPCRVVNIQSTLVTNAALIVPRAGKPDGKAESRPPPYVLNWYANPMGEGGYAESACIPFADDVDVWTAVFGTFVAFAPGRLRLVQDADTRRWRVDQSGILHHFDTGAAPAGPSTPVDDTLRRFLLSRPDVWDGAALVAPWPDDGLVADAERRLHRMSQLAVAYGMAAGARVAASLAAAEDACSAVLAAALAGDVAGAAATSRSASSPPWLATQLVCVASASSTRARARARRRRTGEDGGAASIALLAGRAVVDGASNRSVNEAVTRASKDAPAAAVVAAVVARSLMGGYVSCVRRPTVAVRALIDAMDDAAIMEAVLSMPPDSPLVACAMLEHVADLDATCAPRVSDMCGGAAHWRPRVERARSVMETVRAALDAQWRDGAQLRSVLSALADTMRRAYRRSAVLPPAPAPPPKSEPPVCCVDDAPPDMAALAACVRGGDLADVLLPVSADACVAFVKGDTSALTQGALQARHRVTSRQGGLRRSCASAS